MYLKRTHQVYVSVKLSPTPNGSPSQLVSRLESSESSLLLPFSLIPYKWYTSKCYWYSLPNSSQSFRRNRIGSILPPVFWSRSLKAHPWNTTIFHPNINASCHVLNLEWLLLYCIDMYKLVWNSRKPAISPWPPPIQVSPAYEHFPLLSIQNIPTLWKYSPWSFTFLLSCISHYYVLTCLRGLVLAPHLNFSAVFQRQDSCLKLFLYVSWH